MKRRNLLALAPVAAIVGCGSVCAAAPITTETPVMQLFRQWQEAHRLGNDPGIPEEEANAWGDRMSEVEDKMLSIPSQTMGDVAAKIAAWTSFGDYALSETSDQRIWDEIKALVA